MPAGDANAKGYKAQEIPDVNEKENEKSGQQDSGTGAENNDNAEPAENAESTGNTCLLYTSRCV